MSNKTKLLSVVIGGTICVGVIVGIVYGYRQFSGRVKTKSEKPTSEELPEELAEVPPVYDFTVIVWKPLDDTGTETSVLDRYLDPTQAGLDTIGHLPIRNGAEPSDDRMDIECETNEDTFIITVYLLGGIVTVSGSTIGDPLEIVIQVIGKIIESLSLVVEVTDSDKAAIDHYIINMFNL